MHMTLRSEICYSPSCREKRRPALLESNQPRDIPAGLIKTMAPGGAWDKTRAPHTAPHRIDRPPYASRNSSQITHDDGGFWAENVTFGKIERVSFFHPVGVIPPRQHNAFQRKNARGNAPHLGRRPAPLRCAYRQPRALLHNPLGISEGPGVSCVFHGVRTRFRLIRCYLEPTEFGIKLFREAQIPRTWMCLYSSSMTADKGDRGTLRKPPLGGKTATPLLLVGWMNRRSLAPTDPVSTVTSCGSGV